MWRFTFLELFILGCTLSPSPVTSLWSCAVDSDCSSLAGGVCQQGACVCPVGKQPVRGGSVCADVAPYLTSTCVEDYQCSRLAFTFQCRRDNETDETGNCFCQPNHHYYRGRCWPTVQFEEPCSRSEECMSTIRDPSSMTCDGTCRCAEGYYQRQRGECRKIGSAVGDGCVLDADCQFQGGACDVTNFVCYNSITGARKHTSTSNTSNLAVAVTNSAISRQHLVSCDATTLCAEPFVCSAFGVCFCPVGYYPSEDGSTCLAELGSPSTPEQCVGLLAVVADGVCTCPANFFYNENMRDCIRVTRRLEESCVIDENCHTFGQAAFCGEEQLPWGLRSCSCDTDLAVWDSNLQMCRLFAGIGEYCLADSDCMAGELEIVCLLGETGEGYCACPEGYTDVDGLCLTTGLVLGDACQATQECTGTENTVCEDGRCSCDSSGYQEIDGSCAPLIGGVCEQDSDCVIENTLCSNSTDGLTCLCRDQFLEYDDQCWPVLGSLDSICLVSAQCQDLMGEPSFCDEEQCQCTSGHHLRDGGCWPVTGLFESCSRTSQCYLSEGSERAVCRNSLCQCDFNYPYSEQLATCTSSASRILAITSLFLAIQIMLSCIL